MSCVEKRFSPVPIGAAYCAATSASSAKSSGSVGSSNQRRPNGDSAHAYASARSRLECAVGVDGETLAVVEHFERRFDALHVFGYGRAADLDFHRGVAFVEAAPDFVLQIFQPFAGVIPPAADVALHLVQHFAVVVALGEHAMERLVFDLGDRVPARDFDGADRDRALGVAARLLALHHARENFLGIEVRSRRVDERRGIGFEDARNEARAHLRAARIAAGGVERVADDGLAAAHDVGDDGDDRGRHLAEVERGVAHARLQRNGDFADVYDAHGNAILDLDSGALHHLAPLLDFGPDLRRKLLRACSR